MRNNISKDGPNRTKNDRVTPFLPKFWERTQKFSKIEKFKKSPRGPKHFFLADLVFVLHDLIVFNPIFRFLESFWNCPKILKFLKMWKTWYRKTIRTQPFLVRFCSSFEMMFLTWRATQNIYIIAIQAYTEVFLGFEVKI